ncbi:GAF and ANTAR domain-containing protein [Pseudoclavibacter sp. AY1F1]|uniref:GAF and ANTAR domain-containing protein n=1 Tax=Pseudoclavibacter sp. AY1F1 TaxID=2080583 RepID=UPI0015E44288|nr:GAF and ANTAR domain-containing protein [Pseudoclavibacter sp. AY1F1]
MARDAYDAAVQTLQAPLDSVEAVADSLVDLFPVSGAAVSTIGELLGNQTVSASNEIAARLDELQFDLGEGPCWDTLATGRPVLAPNLHELPETRWPVFGAAIPRDQVGALFAFPMLVGPLQVGAIDLYAAAPTNFEPLQTKQASRLATLVARNVLRLALAASHDEPRPESKHSRRKIHQATGMVLAQLETTADEATLVIQGHAFATGQPMMKVAEEILAGRLAFHSGPSGIEERR